MSPFDTGLMVPLAGGLVSRHQSLFRLVGRVSIGLLVFLLEALMVAFGQLSYRVQAANVIQINASSLPLSALLGWPLSTLLLYTLVFDVHRRFEVRGRVRALLAMTGLISALSFILTLLYVTYPF